MNSIESPYFVGRFRMASRYFPFRVARFTEHQMIPPRDFARLRASRRISWNFGLFIEFAADSAIRWIASSRKPLRAANARMRCS
jgi:hypothetical protein